MKKTMASIGRALLLFLAAVVFLFSVGTVFPALPIVGSVANIATVGYLHLWLPLCAALFLRRMGEVWANGLPLTDPRVSPIYGELAGLGRVTLTTGTWEILYPDTLLLAKKLEDAGVQYQLIVGERMIHCYPICPIPEAKDAQAVIWKAITG